METFEKILDLNNEFEAGLLKEVLTDKNIPFGIVPSGDSAMGGVWELENGWGYVEAPEEYRNEIIRIYKEISEKSRG